MDRHERAVLGRLFCRSVVQVNDSAAAEVGELRTLLDDQHVVIEGDLCGLQLNETHRIRSVARPF